MSSLGRAGGGVLRAGVQLFRRGPQKIVVRKVTSHGQMPQPGPMKNLESLQMMRNEVPPPLSNGLEIPPVHLPDCINTAGGYISSELIEVNCCK